MKDNVWTVIGGKFSGGILVRNGPEHDSVVLLRRLAHGSTVRELGRRGSRVKYHIIDGGGPPTGWVCIALKGRPFIVLTKFETTCISGRTVPVAQRLGSDNTDSESHPVAKHLGTDCGDFGPLRQSPLELHARGSNIDCGQAFRRMRQKEDRQLRGARLEGMQREWSVVVADVEWIVVHARVMKRFAPSLSALICGCELKGAPLRGDQVEVDGVAWLRIPRGRANGTQDAWMLMDGSSLGFGELVQRARCSVRKTVDRGMVLVALQAHAAGETVIEDAPFFTRPPSRDIFKIQGFTNKFEDLLSKISEPLHCPSDPEHSAKGPRVVASRAMVRDAVGYVRAPAPLRERILGLSHPALDSSHPLVAVARKVAELCVGDLPECSRFSAQELQLAILAIEMNVFCGGHVFPLLSRANHSCSPNVVFIAGEGRFKALRSLSAEDELVHSYLGAELLLPTEIRRRHLWRSKCFHCSCPRCSAAEDPMRDLPCLECQQQRRAASTEKLLNPYEQCSLDPAKDTDIGHAEDWGFALFLGDFILDPFGGRFSMEVDRPGTDLPQKLWLPRPSGTTVADLKVAKDHFKHQTLEDTSSLSYARWHPNENTWICKSCGCATAKQRMAEPLLGRCAERTFLRPALARPVGLKTGGIGPSGGLELQIAKRETIAYALELSAVVWGALGFRHWAGQWARLFVLDVVITLLEVEPPSRPKDRILLKWVLATLDEVWSWLQTLGLAHDPSCFLYSRVDAALRLVGGNRWDLDHACKARVDRLASKFNLRTQQVEVLPMRNISVDGRISFQ